MDETSIQNKSGKFVMSLPISVFAYNTKNIFEALHIIALPSGQSPYTYLNQNNCCTTI